MTRVTETMMFDSLTRGISLAKSRALRAQEQAQTGRRVNTVSDDPVAAERATLLDSQQSRLLAMDGISARVQANLGATSTALSDAVDILETVRNAARGAANGQMDPAGMDALATTVDQQFTSLLSVANSQTDSGYVFAGYQDSTKPFDLTGAYAGDAGVRSVEVAPGQIVTANVSGAQAFTAAGGVDVFSVVSAIHAGLAANDKAAVATQLNALDTAIAQMKTASNVAAASYTATKAADATRTGLKTQVANARDAAVGIDDATASINLLAAQTAVEKATAQASSVLDMLKTLPF
jgi:flagellar hook-associated protein 3 FlgL